MSRAEKVLALVEDAFCNSMLKEIMIDVKKHATKEQIKQAWVYKSGRTGEFHGPDKFYHTAQWHCAACMKYNGWEVWLRQKGVKGYTFSNEAVEAQPVPTVVISFPKDPRLAEVQFFYREDEQGKDDILIASVTSLDNKNKLMVYNKPGMIAVGAKPTFTTSYPIEYMKPEEIYANGRRHIAKHFPFLPKDMVYKVTLKGKLKTLR